MLLATFLVFGLEMLHECARSPCAHVENDFFKSEDVSTCNWDNGWYEVLESCCDEASFSASLRQRTANAQEL